MEFCISLMLLWNMGMKNRAYAQEETTLRLDL
jgi:hypothetical protein